MPDEDVAVHLAFPLRRQHPLHPPEEYAALRDEQPVCPVELPTGQRAWLLTRHDQVRELLAHPRASADRAHPGFPRPVPGAPRRDPLLLGMDPPEHTAHRRRVLAEFTVHRVKALRPRIQQIVDERLAAFLAGPRPVDLVAELALPVPSLVICELLGVPYADRDIFQGRTRVLVDHRSPVEARMSARRELTGYLDGLVTAQEREPGDDLLGRLVTRYRADGAHDHDVLVGMATILLVAGHETTANMISLGVAGLLAHPDQLALLRADPRRMPQAVEELLRFFTIIDHGTARVAAEDIELGGVRIGAGEGVVAALGAANRDGRVFPDPDRLDLGRGARQHVAFGYGVHQCLGQNLARAELEIVFAALVERIPGLRLAVPLERLPFKEHSGAYGLHELPVTW